MLNLLSFSLFSVTFKSLFFILIILTVSLQFLIVEKAFGQTVQYPYINNCQKGQVLTDKGDNAGGNILTDIPSNDQLFHQNNNNNNPSKDCSFTIPNPPESISQCKSNTGGFATILMMLSYRDSISYTPNDVLHMLDQKYLNLIYNNQRISDPDLANLVNN